MVKKSVDERFSFTWGLPILDKLGYVELYVFMLRTYTALGLTRTEMLCLIHLASYKYNSPRGRSRPTLTTVAEEMGYSHKQRVSELVSSLKNKKMLRVTYREGLPSEYDANPFARKALAYTIEHYGDELADIPQETDGVTLESDTPSPSVTLESDTPSPSVTTGRDPGLLPSVTKEPKEPSEKRETDFLPSPIEQEREAAILWQDTLLSLQLQLEKATFDANLLGSQALGRENGTLTVDVRHENAVAWLDGRLRPTIERTLRRVAEDDELRVAFVAEDGGSEDNEMQ